MNKFLFLSSLFLLAFIPLVQNTLVPSSVYTQSAYAQNYSEQLTIGKTIGDGKLGNIWAPWRETIREQAVSRITAILKKKRGHNTYVNMRFGKRPAFQGGKRVSLPDGEVVTATWNLMGETPKGQKLVMNIYGGEAYLESVRIEYLGSDRKTRPDEIILESSGRSRNDFRNPNKRITDDDESAVVRRCDRKRRLRTPEIEIDNIKTSGGLFSGKHRIKGSIVGACIEEAGYYEGGKLKESFNIPLSDRYKRTSFEIKVRASRRGEIRVLNYDGGVERFSVENIIRDGSDRKRPVVDSFPFN